MLIEDAERQGKASRLLLASQKLLEQVSLDCKEVCNLCFTRAGLITE